MTVEKLMALLTRLGVRQLRLRHSNITGCCPIHGERRPSWGISTAMPHVYGCFSCGAKGTLLYLLTEHFRLEPVLASNLVGVANNHELAAKWPNELRLMPVTTQAGAREDFDVHVMEPVALRYLLRRQFTVPDIVRADIRYYRGQQRLLFPWLVDDVFCGASSRTINPNERNKGQAFFGLRKSLAVYNPRLAVCDSPVLFITEGELDALRVATCCPHNVLALGHARYSAGQLNLALNCRPQHVVLFFDNDKAGAAITAEYTTELLRHIHLSVHAFDYGLFPHYKDPADFAPGVLRFVLRNWSTFVHTRRAKSLVNLSLV